MAAPHLVREWGSEALRALLVANSFTVAEDAIPTPSSVLCALHFASYRIIINLMLYILTAAALSL